MSSQNITRHCCLLCGSESVKKWRRLDGNRVCDTCYSSSEPRRAYRRTLTKRHKTKCITILGAKCVLCSSTNNLEIHHVNGDGMIDRVRFHNSMCGFYSYYGKHVDEFRQKCRLLCRKCHGKSHRHFSSSSDSSVI